MSILLVRAKQEITEGPATVLLPGLGVPHREVSSWFEQTTRLRSNGRCCRQCDVDCGAV